MKVRSRFSYFRDKLQVFFLGLLLGIVLCTGFFVLKFDQYIKELSIYKSLTEKDERDENDLVDPKDEKDQPETKQPKEKPRKTEMTDNVAMSLPSDSMPVDSGGSQMTYTNQAGGDEIVVRKDELLGQKTLSIQNLDVPADSANAKTASDNTHFVTVECWRSPLNYRGYKFSRNRLVLFGFEMGDVTALYKSQNFTYIKSALGVFRVEISADFRQLERVTDESIIARMQ